MQDQEQKQQRSQAFIEGRTAGTLLLASALCPFEINTKDWTDWQEGFLSALADVARRAMAVVA